MVQRFLLCTDGTVTRVLEDFAGEPVLVHKLCEELIKAKSPAHLLDIREPEQILVRNVLLQGSRTGRNLIYAESLLRTESLGSDLLEALLVTETPLGLLFRERRLETFRELVSHGIEDAGDWAVHFGLDPTVRAFSRTYRIIQSQRPLALITEKFPVGGALQDAPARARS
jgi:chorismate-pyruvate lyase